ncbi:unnamed protein product [Lymnaea stagnalis]|uniref:AIG1-type G domain-containing protein n=1 Tax=Lymnaea stagnalis TaxID=6523 RepID=A0AAV2H9W7_LYMST
MWGGRRSRSKTMSSFDSTVHSFLLIGKCGNGKSSSGNAITGKKHFFAPFHTTQACTKAVTKCETQRWGKRIIILDTPGLADTELDDIENAEFARKNMIKSFRLCPGGFSAFLIVMNYTNTFNNEEKQAIETLTEIFGNEMFASSILIFTHGDNFDIDQKVSNYEYSQKEFVSWCLNVQGDLQILLQKCNYRAVLFHNNKWYEKERDLEMVELFEKLEELKRNKYSIYQFNKNEARRKKLILNKYPQQLKDKISKELGELKDDVKIITHQNDTLHTRTKQVLDKLMCDEMPQKVSIQNATRNLLDNFENMANNQVKFDFLSEILKNMNRPFLQELGTHIADIKKILHPEKHKNELKRKVSLLLEYVKEQGHGTKQLHLEEQRVKMFQREIEALDTRGGDIVTEIKW